MVDYVCVTEDLWGSNLNMNVAEIHYPIEILVIEECNYHAERNYDAKILTKYRWSTLSESSIINKINCLGPNIYLVGIEHMIN